VLERVSAASLMSHRAVIFITDPALLGHQTPEMAERTLKDVTYSEAIPTSGRCSECGRPFSTPRDAMADPGRATKDFYSAFVTHECSSVPN